MWIFVNELLLNSPDSIFSLCVSLSNEITDLQDGFPVSLQQQLTGGFIQKPLKRSDRKSVV